MELEDEKQQQNDREQKKRLRKQVKKHCKKVELFEKAFDDEEEYLEKLFNDCSIKEL